MSCSSFSCNSFYYTGDLLEWRKVRNRSVIYNLMIASQSFSEPRSQRQNIHKCLLHRYQFIFLRSWPVHSCFCCCLFVFKFCFVLFSILADIERHERVVEGSGRSFLPASEIKIWQNPFSWRIGFCCGEDSECIWQSLLFPFPCQSQEGIFCVSSWRQMWTTPKGCSRLCYYKFAYVMLFAVHHNYHVPTSLWLQRLLLQVRKSQLYSGRTSLSFKISTVWS